MANRTRKSHPGRGGLKVSVAPLTADQALAAALRVKPADLKRVEQAEAKRNGHKNGRNGA
jgi:hypothetical protein